MGGNLKGCTDAQLKARFSEGVHDLAQLKALQAVLRTRNSDAAFELELAVAQAITRLNRGQPLSPMEVWLRQFLLVRRLGQPDGRALHRYRLTDDEYQGLGRLLLTTDGKYRLRQKQDIAARLFVLYAAEWFRREAVSLYRLWAHVAPVVLGVVDDNIKRYLTLKGLHYWKRPLLRTEHGREFLITLSLEGGIPANVVLEDSSASLGGYLRLIMRSGLQDATLEHLSSTAYENREALPPTYRHDDFIQQCAELCERLLYWRRQAEAAQPGMDPVIYLDGLHTEWRRDLPIYVPVGQDSGLTRLLNGLMRERLSGPSTVGVSACRLLILKDGIWQQAVRLTADGDISKHRFPSAVSAVRVGIVPSGRLADHVPGDFAVAYPPDGEQVTWRIRPRVKLVHALTGFEFSRAVMVNLVDGGASTAWTWPGGEAVSSDLCVFETDQSPASDVLVLKARGSYSSPAKTLYVWAPDRWRVEGPGVVPMAAFPLRKPGYLYRLDAVAYVIPDDDNTRFRIEPDSMSREERLIIPGAGLHLEAADTRMAFAYSPLKVKIETHGREREPRPNEIFWRRPKGRWLPLVQGLRADGLIELSWRDPLAGIQIEKQRLCLIPPDAKIDAALRDQTEALIALDGLPEWSLSLEEPDVVLEVLTPAACRLRFGQRPVFRVRLRLHPPQGPAIPIILPIRAREAVIIGADGCAVAPGAILDLAALRGARLLSQGAACLQITTSAIGKGEAFNLTFSEEYPLSSLRGVIEEMLANAGEQDARVRLTFVGETRLPVWVQRYRYERPVPTVPLVLPEAGIPVARMVCQPKYEYALTAVAGGYVLPDVCAGPTLVYVRDGPDILSRPLAIKGSGDLSPVNGHLREALTEPVFDRRQKAMREVMQGFAFPEASFADLDYFNVHIASLKGVPATAFDALKILGQTPEALTRVLVHARDTVGVEAVWKLQNELPFLWLALPVEAWRKAFHAEAGGWHDELSRVESAMRSVLVIQQMREAADRVVACEPALAAILTDIRIPFSNEPSPVDIRALANAYIARFSDHPDPAGLRMPALPKTLTDAGLVIPKELRHFSLDDWGGLCAPGVLAACALGKLRIAPAQALLLRRVLRDAPDYVSQAYAVFFKDYR